MYVQTDAHHTKYLGWVIRLITLCFGLSFTLRADVIVCPTIRGTLENLVDKLPKFTEGGTECATIAITDRKFPKSFNVKFVDLESDKEPNGDMSGGTSDFFTFENVGAHAVICFSSDPAIGQCPPVAGETTSHFEDPKKGGTFTSNFPKADGKPAYDVTIFSDGASGKQGAESDTIKIEIAKTPEPPSLLLAMPIFIVLLSYRAFKKRAQKTA